MIEVDFDIDVLPATRRLMITHRCYSERGENKHAERLEAAIAENLEATVEKWARNGLAKDIGKLGYSIQLVSRNPKVWRGKIRRS